MFASIVAGLFLLSVNEHQDKSDIFVFIDNSVSQSIEIDDEDPLASISTVLSELDMEASDLTILTNDLSTTTIKLSNNEVELDLLSTLDYSFIQIPFSEVIDRMQKSGSKKSLIFTDMQGIYKDELIDIKKDTTRSYSFLVRDQEEDLNVYVDTAFVQPDANDINSILLNLKINSTLDQSDNNIVVKLFSNMKQLSSVVSKGAELNDIVFDIPKSDANQYRIDISGDDALYDNSYFLSIPDDRKPRISLISDSENLYLSNLFTRNDLFDFFQMNRNTIDLSLIGSSDLIVINDLSSIPSGILDGFNGTILIFPNESTPYSDDILGTGISMLKNNSEGSYRSTFDIRNKLFSGIFNAKKVEGDMPLGSPLYLFNGTFESVLKLSNGETFLAKSAKKDIYILSCPLSEEYTSLPTHGIFLPIMYQMAIQSTKNGNYAIGYYPNDRVEVENSVSEFPIKLAGENYEDIPEFNRVGKTTVLQIPAATPPGFYSLVQNRDTIRNIAINLSKSESVRDGLAFSDLENYFGNDDHVTVQRLDGKLELSDLQDDSPFSLWKYALILTLLLALTEIMFHRYLR